MDIFNSFDDKNTVSLGCFPEHSLSSLCLCEKFKNHGNFYFKKNNIDIYTNISIHGVINLEIDQNLGFNYLKNILNCVNIENATFCNFSTSYFDLTKSRCNCAGENNLIFLQGHAPTVLLFQGLENFTFPIHHKNINID